MTAPAPSIERTEVDGVPIFVGSYPHPLGAGIVFRVGRADESLATGGISHLVEHLALSGQLGRRYEADGWVDELFTGFYLEGEPSGVVTGMSEICRALSDLPLDRLDHERRILLVEGAGSGPAGLGEALHTWFGPTGHGLMGSRELGLQHLSATRVAAWARERFTSGNAAAWVTGPIPKGLAFPIPPGKRWHPPAWRPNAKALPAEAFADNPGVSVSFPIEQGLATSVMADVAEAALMRRLRSGLGLTYHVDRQVRDLDQRTFFALLHADCRAEEATTVRDEMLRVLRDMADSTVSDEDMALSVAARVRDLRATTTHRGALLEPVGDELFGRRWRSPQGAVEELLSLRPQGIATLMARAIGSALVIVPEGTEGPAPGFIRHEPIPPAPIQGQRFRARTLSAPPLRSRLVLGPEGLSVRYGSGEEITVWFEHLVAALRWKSGDWVLVSENGDEATLRPRHWERGGLILKQLEAAISPDLLVPMDGIDPAPFERTARSS